MVCTVRRNLKDRWSAIPRRVRFWLVGGVLPTFATLALLVFGDMWIGYKFTQALSNHFLDFCLSTFTLAVSIFSGAVDLDRQIDQKKRISVIGTSAGLGFFCVIIFCFLYYRKLLIDKQIQGIQEMTPSNLITFVHIIFIILAFGVIRTGIKLEKETASPLNTV